MEGKPVAEQDIGRQLLQETAAYAESSVCRRKMLLHYFGEEYNKQNCHNCDNCLHPKEKIEASKALLVVLKSILAIKENFRQEYIIDFVKGRGDGVPSGNVMPKRLLYPAVLQRTNLKNYQEAKAVMGGDELSTKLMWQK
jgi:hypothetical protein